MRNFDGGVLRARGQGKQSIPACLPQNLGFVSSPSPDLHQSPRATALCRLASFKSAEGHSYTGPVTIFGKNYQGNYAPLIAADGKMTGALFVGVAK
jgi:hypothetical protein